MHISRNIFLKPLDQHRLARRRHIFKARRRGPWGSPPLWEHIALRVSLILACVLMWTAIVLTMRALAGR